MIEVLRGRSVWAGVILLLSHLSIAQVKPGDDLRAAILSKSTGGVIELAPGTYHQNVLFDKTEPLTGTAQNPIIIKAQTPGTVFFDGTVDLSSLSWEQVSGKPYWKTTAKVPEDVWQLFVDGDMMINARWPNADHPFEDFQNSSWWDRTKSWCKAEPGSGTGYEYIGQLDTADKWVKNEADILADFHGYMTNDGLRDMSATGFDFNNVVGVLNNASMTSYSAIIKNYNSTTQSFDYDLDPIMMASRAFGGKQVENIHTNGKHAYFYFESSLQFLDAEREWFYQSDLNEPDHGILYLYPPAGQDPNTLTIKGKNQDFAFLFDDCEYVHLEGINFFATTVKFNGVTGGRVENCTFEYPSYSKRMLKDVGEIPHTAMVQKFISTTLLNDDPENLPKTANVFINNYVAKTDGMGLEMTTGVYDSIVNNEFEYIDISGTQGGSQGVDYRKGYRTHFIRNTIRICGASAATKSSKRPINVLNDFSYWGYLQGDGSGFQVAGGGQEGSLTQQNWLHDTKKSGMRFDGDPDVKKEVDIEKLAEGTFARNVVWNNPLGFMVKGNFHRVYNNVAFNNTRQSMRVMGEESNPNANTLTETKNNVLEDLSGNRNGNFLTSHIPGDTATNWVGKQFNLTVAHVLRDPENFDFRPKYPGTYGDQLIDQGTEHTAGFTRFLNYSFESTTEGYSVGTPDIGAYDYGAPSYWIPGRQLDVPSRPVPMNGSTTAKTDLDLMWLKPYLSDTKDISTVYVGTSADALVPLANTTEYNIAYNADIKDALGIEAFDPAQEYFWQVSTVMNGQVRTSPVWSFVPGSIPYIPCPDVHSFSDGFETPLGAEDFNSPTWNATQSTNFLGYENLEQRMYKVQLFDDQLLIRSDIPEGVTTYSTNTMQTDVLDIPVADFPFIKFSYKAKDRTVPFQFFTKILPKVPYGVAQKKSNNGINVVSLEPSGNQYKSIIIDITENLDDVRNQLNKTYDIDGKTVDYIWGDTIERFRFVVNPTMSWDYATEGNLFIDDFKVGYEAIKDDLENITIVGQYFNEKLPAGFKRIFTASDFMLEAQFRGYTIPLTECMHLNSNWSMVFEPGTGYSVTGNVIAIDEDIDGLTELKVPTYINMDGVASEKFTLTIPLEIKPTISVDLIKGWNLVSLNIQPDNSLTGSVFQNAEVVKTQDAFWNNTQPKYLNSLPEIKAGKGYLVYNSVDETIELSGELLIHNSPLTINAGWNLIGVSSQTPFSVSGLPAETESVKDFGEFHIPPSDGLLEELLPGKAYFIKVNANCELNW